MTTAIEEKCTPFVCRHECLDYVRTLKMHPCFQGDVGDLVRLYGLYRDMTTTDEVLKWFTKLDSCDWELWQEGGGDMTDHTGGATSGVTSLMTSAGMTLTMVMSLLRHY